MVDRKLILESTLDCNANCIYCYNLKNKVEYNTNIEKFMIQEKYLRKWKINNVIITGGEPLLILDKIIQIIKHYRNKVEKIELITNGLLLDNFTIKKLIASGLNVINVSCDGVSDLTQYKLRKIKAEAIWNKINCIKELSEDNLKLNLLYTITKLNDSKKDIISFTRKAIKAKVDGIKIQPLTVDLNNEIKTILVPNNQMLSIIKEIKENAKLWRIANSEDFFKVSKLIYSNEFDIDYICEVPKKNLFVNAKGLLMRCPILNSELEIAIHSSFEKTKFNKIKCQLKSHCLCMF